jgi:arylsulfatase A-like enzyme
MPASAILLSALGFGLVTGLIEVTAHLVRRHGLGRILEFGPDFIWMTPLANGFVFLLAGLLLLLFSLLLKRLRAPIVGYAVFATLMIFGPLLLVEQLHKAASLLLAMGFGSAIARGLAPRSERVTRAFTWVVPSLLVLLPALGGVRYALLRRNEHLALSRRDPAAGGAPNVLLLVLDTVRAWNLGFAGHWRQTTPRLAKWIARSTVFERALATAPWTAPSHATMFTGHLPIHLSANWETPLDGTWKTLAEVLRDRGYATAGFVGNYRYAGSATGLDRGFDRYQDYPVSVEQALRSAQLPAHFFRIGGVGVQLGKRRLIQGGKTASEVNHELLEWLQARSDPTRPFFAFLNYFDAHGPYTPPPPWDSTFTPRTDSARSRRYWDRMLQVFGPGPLPVEFLEETYDAYDGSIAYLDFQVDSLLTTLEQRGLLVNTIVVITSDHGEQFGEHGLVQHGNSLFLPLLNVPLVIHFPVGAPIGVKVQAPASLRDLAATVLDLAGAEGSGIPGRSLMEWLNPARDSARRDTLFSAVDYHPLIPTWPPSPVIRGDMRSVVLDSLHYIRNGDGVEELFHLGRDSRETVNLATLPVYASDLARHRAALEVQAGSRGPGTARPLPKELP